MDITYLFIASAIVAALGLTLGALFYAARTGNLSDLQAGSVVIFAERESIGPATEAFLGTPGMFRSIPQTARR